MVVAAGFTAEARPLRLLYLDITTMFEARGVPPLRASCVVAQLESRKDSSMVVAAGLSAEARPSYQGMICADAPKTDFPI